MTGEGEGVNWHCHVHAQRVCICSTDLLCMVPGVWQYENVVYNWGEPE